MPLGIVELSVAHLAANARVAIALELALPVLILGAALLVLWKYVLKRW